eukprot:TRINITY_DN8420_c0_g1_i1.p1 TRINITY_DN8420_c0_g1~~TRINITY_DN8420_c0_g1_i1.p1  ORF type:complete len:238 (-),score=38.74 TRINITY_DN8420_c0_g1_i1:14-691(-)
MRAESDEERDAWISSVLSCITCLSANNLAICESTKTDETTISNNKEKVVSLDDFQMVKLIGRGCWAKLFEVYKKDDHEIYAMKVLRKENEGGDYPRPKKLVNPFVVELFYDFQTDNRIYYVIQYVRGGELFFYLQREKMFNNELTRFYCAEILCGLEYLHKQGILQRVEPENILLTDDGHICLTHNFGIPEKIKGSFTGIPEYIAPEILLGEESSRLVVIWDTHV